MPWGSVDELKLEDFNALVNVHLAAGIILVQAALPTMKSAGFGRVVLVSSRAVLGLATRTSYSAGSPRRCPAASSSI